MVAPARGASRSDTISAVDRSPVSPATLIYAHRGDRSRAPDNTLEAFALAVDAGAHGIELDVRRTSDGVLVLSHDPAIGELPPIHRLRFDELRSIAPFVPSLSEGLAHIPPHVFVNVEIKNIVQQPDFDASRSIVHQTLALIDGEDDRHRILLSSFDPESVRSTPERATALRGLLITSGIPLEAAIRLATELDTRAIHPPMSTVAADPESAVAAARRAGLALVVWDANTPSEIHALAEAGVDVIITDDPAMARAVLG